MSCSIMRKNYILRFVGRVFVLLAAVGVYIVHPASFSILDGMNFFRKVSILHLLWGLWVLDMVLQMIPSRRFIALGSQKQFGKHFQPAPRTPDRDALRGFIKSSNRSAAAILIVWILLVVVVGGLYLLGILDRGILVLLSAAFYVCDLICVLFWCPFRVFFMKNRCCTTCRIFNWDHLMMFLHLLFIPGFFTLSLGIASVIIFLVWEVLFHRHPERFWDRSNRALRCISCTDRLCGRRLIASERKDP